MEEKYLPLGTVVLLKNAKKRLMITGFYMHDKKTDKSYDYSGCLFPEGIIDTSKTALFDHSQIEKVFYKGLEDEEWLKFKEKLNLIKK